MLPFKNDDKRAVKSIITFEKTHGLLKGNDLKQIKQEIFVYFLKYCFFFHNLS